MTDQLRLANFGECSPGRFYTYEHGPVWMGISTFVYVGQYGRPCPVRTDIQVATAPVDLVGDFEKENWQGGHGMRSIVLDGTLRSDIFRDTFYHEVGHALFDSCTGQAGFAMLRRDNQLFATLHELFADGFKPWARRLEGVEETFAELHLLNLRGQRWHRGQRTAPHEPITGGL